MRNELEEKINNDSYNFTVDYAIKLLERLTILLSNEKPTEIIDKYILLKTAAIDICFSCELLLKSRVSTYSNSLNSWNTHNLLNVFNELSLNDQTFLSNELGISIPSIINILSDKATSDAFIKRYLYEPDTGIPDYSFLCNFANALIKLNNRNITYDLSNIDVLNSNFNYQQFSFEDIIEKHSLLVFRKSEIYNIGDINDQVEEYIVKNMKSCDYALFSELRYKYFDKNQNPKKDHEFSQLHKRLDDACKFLIAKSRFMDRYMNKESTMDFRWALESLMFYENFGVGDTVKELYSDINETFEKSRYCTIEYYDNYYNAYNFATTIKSITDLLMMDVDKANRIIKNKNELLSLFGLDFMKRMEFSVDEVDKIDIGYLKELSKITSMYVSKEILLENNDSIRKKIFYFIKALPDSQIPKAIDDIVTNTPNGYIIDMDKYQADLNLENNYIYPSKERIKKYIKLSKTIKFKYLILAIIKRNIDLNIAITKYNEIISKCNKFASKPEIIEDFINNFGIIFIDGYDLNRLNKFFLLFDYFMGEKCDIFLLSDITVFEKLYNYSLADIITKFCLFKKHALQNLFFSQLDSIINMNDKELNNYLHLLKKNKNIEDPSSIPQGSFISTDSINRMKEIDDLLKSKKLLFLYNSNIGMIDDIDLLNELLTKDLVNNINDNKYNDEDREALVIFTRCIFENKQFKDVLLDLLDTEIVINHPKVLLTFGSWYSVNENIYRVNIFNGWYKKIISNNLNSNGNKIKLDSTQIKNLEQLLIETITNINDYHEKEELSNRLETLFTDNQLVQSMNTKILSHYQVEFMKKVINISKFKVQDFNSFNYFGNLFEVIETNMISEDKIVELLNILYNYKNNKIVMNFVEKLCSCKKTSVLSSIIYEDKNGQKEFDEELIDYLILNLNTKNETDIVGFISNVKIEIDNPEIIVEEESHISKSYDDSVAVGKEILFSIKSKLSNDFHIVLNKVIEIISCSYIANKLKIYALNNKYKRINKGVDQGREKNR